VRIRPATAGDVPAVLELDRELFGPDAWSEQSVREELTGPRRSAVVACDAVVVGYLVTAWAGDVVDLQRVAVRSSHRRRGLAHRLLAEALEHPGAERMLLEVGADNEAALAFYAAEGFREVHRRERYYRNGSGAVVMERVLR
jgi:[ribosomal protein S18]-alanine N-acetyltransferase